MKKIGKYLKSARLRLGISLKEVYNITGISDSRLSRIENETTATETAPSILRALAELYHINIVDLYVSAGYLDSESLSLYEQVFWNVNLLNDAEKKLIQEQINLFTAGRG